MKMGADLWRAAIAVLALSLVNSLVRPVLRFFGAPLNLMTLGLFGLIVNSVLFWAVGNLSHGYQVSGVVGLFVGPMIMGAITGLLSLFIPD
jgi:putative membrane protein